MRYLVVEEIENNHYLINEITRNLQIESEASYIKIYDLELRLFHVKDNIWQKIQEK